MSKPDYGLFGSLKLVHTNNLKKLKMWARQTPLVMQAELNDLCCRALSIPLR